ncbi:MAG: exo-alpha-sialidase [Deltaproteobacteria bacterium]|nr:exo-alpha-sialidase [Deltaproteobacteria bacterium]
MKQRNMNQKTTTVFTLTLQKIRRRKALRSRKIARPKGVLTFFGPHLGCTKLRPKIAPRALISSLFSRFRSTFFATLRFTLACAGAFAVWGFAACGSDDANGSDSAIQNPDAQSGTQVQSGTTGGSVPDQVAGEQTAGSSGTGGSATTDTSVSGTGGTAIDTPDAMIDGGSAIGLDSGTVSLDAVAPDAASVIELAPEPTNVDVTQNIHRRYGAPHVAVNPQNPNNIVVLASSNLGYTRDCVPPAPGSDCELVSVPGMPFMTQPRGFAKTPGFMDIGVFVSFDRGRSFEYVDVTDMVPPGHPEVRARGEGPIAVNAEGTFFIGFNAINWGNWENDFGATEPLTFFPNGGVGVIKSTDGGKTWKWVSYSGTPADWPYGGIDRETGSFYVTSGLAGISNLGPRSTGLPDSPAGTIADRWISSTKDGETWTDPQPLGGSNGASHMVSGHSSVAAAHGIMATLFLSYNQASCSFFVGSGATAPCTVFQTSTDAGATWSRHRVPTPAGFAPQALNVLLAADSSTKGLFTVALLKDSGSHFLVYRTPDCGETWGEPVEVTEDMNKTHFAPFVAKSPNGDFGLMWRTYEPNPANPMASPPFIPYSVWAVVSHDGGATFSQPLRVSKDNSPSPPNDPNDYFAFIGDHGPSGMAMDGDGGVYVVWADWTPGERAIFFSAIDIRTFTFE